MKKTYDKELLELPEEGREENVSAFDAVTDFLRGNVPGVGVVESAVESLGEMLYNEYYNRIYRYFSFRIFNKTDAEDLAQTVFLKIFMCLKKGLWEGTGGVCYVFTVARNTLIDYFRRNKYAVLFSDDIVQSASDQMVASDQVERLEERELLTIAMKDLRKEEVQAVTLRYFQDMEYPKIAEIMNKREDAVRQLVHRGVKALESNLKLADLW